MQDLDLALVSLDETVLVQFLSCPFGSYSSAFFMKTTQNPSGKLDYSTDTLKKNMQPSHLSLYVRRNSSSKKSHCLRKTTRRLQGTGTAGTRGAARISGAAVREG